MCSASDRYHRSLIALSCIAANFCFSPLPWQRVLSHQDDTALLKAYIVEWRKFFTQCDILPKPFCQLEITLMGKQGSNKKTNMEDSIVRKVRQLFYYTNVLVIVLVVHSSVQKQETCDVALYSSSKLKQKQQVRRSAVDFWIY